MYKQLVPADVLFFMLYAAMAVVALIACIYLLFRRGNAFDATISSPLRLRRWTAAFFASLALSHVWYLPIVFLSSEDDVMLAYLIGGLLDCLTILPLSIIMLLSMLQDRRRPLWPVVVAVLPLVALCAIFIVCRSAMLLLLVRLYFLLLGLGLIIYMVREVSQYRRWLRDNYADLEHKEVWQNFVVLVLIVLEFTVYATDLEGSVYDYAIQIMSTALVCYLLWRVETLSDLSIAQPLPFSEAEETSPIDEAIDSDDSLTDTDSIGTLLQQYCINAQLYLQHDLTLLQLAQAIGTNRSYLSLYFSRQGMTYNAYINDLRIRHFIELYRQAVAEQRPFTAQQLASESGYRSYSTFSLAFKQRMGQNVTAWMHEPIES
jgi:AraC-like DNA-binding protein